MTSMPRKLLHSHDARVGGLVASKPLQLIVRLIEGLIARSRSELQEMKLPSLATTGLVALALRPLTRSLSQPKLRLTTRLSLR